MDMEEHLADAARKQEFVTTLFDAIAPGYDAFTRYFSFGMDKRWKRRLFQLATERVEKNGIVVDIACGTGDLALGIREPCRPRLVVGLDPSSEMLRVAQAKSRGSQTLAFVAGDALATPIQSGAADAVLMGYCLRNTSDWRRGVAETARILRSGGVFLNLDFYLPANLLWRKLFLFYILRAGQLAGWLWHREPVTYGYIAPSIRDFATATDFEEVLLRSGFATVESVQYLGGAVCVHVAERA